MDENEEPTPTDREEELPELDYADPLKRRPDDESMPGLDPVVPPIPPE